jgi:hypothetical protein
MPTSLQLVPRHRIAHRKEIGGNGINAQTRLSNDVNRDYHANQQEIDYD